MIFSLEPKIQTNLFFKKSFLTPLASKKLIYVPRQTYTNNADFNNRNKYICSIVQVKSNKKY